MRIFVLFFALLLCPYFVSAQTRAQLFQAYIEEFSDIAVRQQQRHGIPASIILAQGLLESGVGRSRLAVEANNHFGIKCHGWTGATIYHDDDEENECFRKYNSVLESFEDHSLFLTSRPHYAFLFELDPLDFRAWAHGLRAAGYATCPYYAYRLIAIIEEFELYRFDRLAIATAQQSTTAQQTASVSQQAPQAELVRGRIQSGAGISAFEPHQVYRVNRRRFVVARAGDTFGSIADQFGVREQQLLSFNEMPEGARPIVGERVFLQRKRTRAPRGYDSHVVQPGESLYSIAQTYGIRLLNLFEINNLPLDERAELGMILRLRP